ncbi:MAG: hypothetical protein KDI69_00250 [Xanthomonadales bacterium]|nr:hypothetical protein [Xanthomonadales bacterium]
MNPFDSPAIAWRCIRHVIVLALMLALVWFVLESLVFRSGFYYRELAEPFSNSGITALKLRLARREATAVPPTVLVFGDSRVAQGFSPAVAKRKAPQVNFINVAVQGSKPRTWYYLLRAMVRKGVAFDAIVIGMVYPPMGADHWANWSLDPYFMASLVDLRDLETFPASFDDVELRRRVQASLWLQTLLMQKDIQSLLESPLDRRRSLRRKRDWLEHIGNYRGPEKVMPTLTFGADHKVMDWNDTNAEQRAAIEQHLRVLTQTPDDNDAYERYWFAELLKLCREHDASLILYPFPRGPYRQILPADNEAPRWLVDLDNEPDVTVLPARLLEDLEAPEYFFDALHANRTGQQITSERVAEAVGEVLHQPVGASTP